MVNFSKVDIVNPKMKRVQNGWEEFFPYYAGYSDVFARGIINSAGLSHDSIVLDPWNGSGTTTSIAEELGISSIGMDINPVMIIVARARSLAASEADALRPLALEILRRARENRSICSDSDQLLCWFDKSTANCIRSIEESIRAKLVGGMTLTECGTKFENISGIAATYYVVLFNLTKNLARNFQSSNPTWLRKPKEESEKVSVLSSTIFEQFLVKIESMSLALTNKVKSQLNEKNTIVTRLCDSTESLGLKESIDLVLTSPPYCTRIDYTAATRIQLAVLSPLLNCTVDELSRSMIGSIKVPKSHIDLSEDWGKLCIDFLNRLKAHPSKASSGYYFKSHTDYFSKLSKSIANVAESMKIGGGAVFVVQDSFYKEIHNDVPSVIVEMAERNGLKLQRRENFEVVKSMSLINARAAASKSSRKNIESVLCFEKLY
jgi:tRNA G10  N-methylase Trm11